MNNLKIAGIVPNSIVDGPGLRLTVFTQGCHHNCVGCHNPDTHDPEGGHEESIETIIEKFKHDPLVAGLTLSGGDPFDQALECARLAIEIKHIDSKYTVWTYTGYTYEQLITANNYEWNLLLDVTDVLVDGPFILSQKSYDLKFRGSKNQRLINVPETRKQGRIVEYQSTDTILDKFQVPRS